MKKGTTLKPSNWGLEKSEKRQGRNDVMTGGGAEKGEEEKKLTARLS